MAVLTGGRACVALVVGVGEYLRAERVQPLQFATQDAVALADALVDPNLCAFPSEQVVVLTDAEARRDELVQRLSKWLPEKARGSDLVVIYFAGHGVVQTVGRREEGFLLPYDADPDDVITKGVAMRDIARWIDGLDTRAVVVCLDCCHAGKLLNQRGPTPEPPARNLELRPAMIEAMAGRGRYLIASCDEGQVSFECADLGHGLFTFHLLRGLAGDADSDGDGRVGVAELFNYVSGAVCRDARQRFGRDQKPWTSATWAEETYLSFPTAPSSTVTVDPIQRVWREQGLAAAIHEIERRMPDAPDEVLKQFLHFFGKVKQPDVVPSIFRCLCHGSAAIRSEARGTLHKIGWENVVRAVEWLARDGDAAGIGVVLEGLNAFEAHPQVVALLDQLVVLLRGDLRYRAILMLERKRLGLGLEQVAALFREINSPYQPRKALGQGLFTASYLARAEGTELDVVVRVLRPEFVQQPHVRAAFLDQCRESLHFVHENLVLTREMRAFPEQNVYYCVRDHVDGVTLQTVLESGKRFESARMVRILRQTVAALSPVHRRGAFHGGIKPSNVFLCADDRVVLGDPCLRVPDGVTLARLPYDYRYAPPELFRAGEDPSPRADFYALGCVAHELISGSPPFVSDSHHELVNMHMHAPLQFPPFITHVSNPGLAEVLLARLLAKRPTDRFQNIDEVIRQLNQFGEPRSESRPHSSSELYRAIPPELNEVPDPASDRVLRTASLANYRTEQSVVGFDESAIDGNEPPTLDTPTGTGDAEFADPLAIPGYEIQRRLGQGGMATVYLARDLNLDRFVAIKLLAGDSPHHGARFSREARVLARLASLGHPNIVPIFQLGAHRDQTFIVMGYLAGGTLAERTVANPLSLREAAEMVRTIARAVAFAHKQGVVHRDLKPSNILLDDRGQPHVVDFGLAKTDEDQEQLTLAGQMVGTPAYMSPDQYRGQISAATDIWALGVILYELLTGRRPFQGRTPIELGVQVLKHEPPSLRTLKPDIPRELEEICLRCLRKQTEERYPSATALADDLDHWLRGEAIGTPTPTLWQQLRRYFSRRKPD